MKGLKQGLNHNTIRTAVLFFTLILSVSAYSQNSPADEYYKDNIAQYPSQSLPSEVYYNKHLRSIGDEWEEDDGPGGSGEGGNAGVGVPVGNGGLQIIACLLVYGIFVYIRKKRRTA